MNGIHAQDVAFILDKEGVAIRTGHHCAEPLVKRMGYTSLARASIGLYTSRQDIDRFAAALLKARSFSDSRNLYKQGETLAIKSSEMYIGIQKNLKGKLMSEEQKQTAEFHLWKRGCLMP